MADRVFTVVVKPRVFTVTGRKSTVHTNKTENEVTYPNGYPGSGSVWETWGNTSLEIGTIPGLFGDYD